MDTWIFNYKNDTNKHQFTRLTRQQQHGGIIYSQARMFRYLFLHLLSGCEQCSCAAGPSFAHPFCISSYSRAKPMSESACNRWTCSGRYSTGCEPEACSGRGKDKKDWGDQCQKYFPYKFRNRQSFLLISSLYHWNKKKTFFPETFATHEDVSGEVLASLAFLILARVAKKAKRAIELCNKCISPSPPSPPPRTAPRWPPWWRWLWPPGSLSAPARPPSRGIRRAGRTRPPPHQGPAGGQRGPRCCSTCCWENGEFQAVFSQNAGLTDAIIQCLNYTTKLTKCFQMRLLKGFLCRYFLIFSSTIRKISF